MVSAAGFEPATHALKEYPAVLARDSNGVHEVRYLLAQQCVVC